jgi:hypothetical protein
MRRGGPVAGRAIGVSVTLRAGCKGAQILSVNIGRFEAITIPELSGMLPNRMLSARTALTMPTSDLESHLIRDVKR